MALSTVLPVDITKTKISSSYTGFVLTAERFRVFKYFFFLFGCLKPPAFPIPPACLPESRLSEAEEPFL